MDLHSYDVRGQRETRFSIPPADGRALRHFRKVIAAKRPRTPNRQRITAFLFVGKFHRKTLTYGLYVRMCATLALPQMRYFLTGYVKLALPRKRKAPF